MDDLILTEWICPALLAFAIYQIGDFASLVMAAWPVAFEASHTASDMLVVEKLIHDDAPMMAAPLDDRVTEAQFMLASQTREGANPHRPIAPQAADHQLNPGVIAWAGALP
ncbi:hypothetical protein ACLHZU_09225 [Aeromonas salmonicida]|uniref:hypothetical protein n=1 Tax=Aeromonas salmonicida TaxID=645 RepID=UPI003D09199C